MSHPFQFIPTSSYASIFLPLLALTITLTVVLGVIPLNPSILKFEFAGNVHRTSKILEAWGTFGQIKAAFSLGLDFLYIVAYSNTISLACIYVATRIQAYRLPLASVGIWLAWGQWLAALLDIVENIALVLILFGFLKAPWPQIAKWCATFKFSLIILGILYAGVGGVIQVILST